MCLEATLRRSGGHVIQVVHPASPRQGVSQVSYLPRNWLTFSFLPVPIHVPYALLLLHLPDAQDMLGRWSVIPVLAVGLCLWTKWKTRQDECRLEQIKLEKVSA